MKRQPDQLAQKQNDMTTLEFTVQLGPSIIIYATVYSHMIRRTPPPLDKAIDGVSD